LHPWIFSPLPRLDSHCIAFSLPVRLFSRLHKVRLSKGDWLRVLHNEHCQCCLERGSNSQMMEATSTPLMPNEIYFIIHNPSITVGFTYDHANYMNSNSDETLDHFITGALPVPAIQAVDSSHEHLSYPSLNAEGDSSRRESSSQPLPSPLFKDRIYVGNLHPSVDECASSQVFFLLHESYQNS